MKALLCESKVVDEYNRENEILRNRETKRPECGKRNDPENTNNGQRLRRSAGR